MNPTILRRILRACDRGAGRRVLGWLTTFYARAATGMDVCVFFDGVWGHRAAGDCLADGHAFPFRRREIRLWRPGPGNVLTEHRAWWFHAYDPKPGDTVVDVGAGAGEDMLIFARAVGASGKVLSVEAHPRTFDLLTATRRWNGLAHCVLTCCAVVDSPKEVFIEDRPEARYDMNTVSCSAGEGGATLRIPGRALDEVCEAHGIGRVDFLKMNIEGAERLAISGMECVLARTRRVCICCHDFLAGAGDWYRTRELVTGFLRDRGFRTWSRGDHPDPWVRDHVHGVAPAADAGVARADTRRAHGGACA